MSVGIRVMGKSSAQGFRFSLGVVEAEISSNTYHAT